MSIIQIIGILITATPFVAIFIIISHALGFRIAITIYALALGLVAFISLGAYLFIGG